MSPITVLLAGPPGIGKTSAALRALGKAAFWVTTEKGALHVARKEVGETPDHVECLSTTNPWLEVLNAVRLGCQGVRAGKYAAIVLDTLSSLADREYDYLQSTMRDGHGRVWNVLGSHVRMIVNEALAADAMVIAICHYEGATDFHPARPKLPGKLGSEGIPSLFSVVLRCELRTGGDGQVARVFRLDASNTIWKDRTGVVVDGEPMDLKSVLRRATQYLRGMPIDRAPVSLLAAPNGGAEGVRL